MTTEQTGRGWGAAGQIWQGYKAFVKRAINGNSDMGEEDIVYWRDRLFTNFITYLLPTCFIALVPGVFMSFKSGYLFVGFADMTAVLLIGVVSLSRGISLNVRKGVVAGILYFLSIVLLVDLSLLGPGVIYLLALSVIITIIFPRYWGYWTVAANLVICILCAVIIDRKLFGSLLVSDYTLGAWVAVSSNLVFLSLVMVMLINSAIDGLERTIEKEFLVKGILHQEIDKSVKKNELLSESEGHFKSLFFQSPSPMWVLDALSLNFLEVNESAINSYGYSNAEFLEMNIKDIKMEKDVATLYKDLQRSKTENAAVSIVTQHRRKTGRNFMQRLLLITSHLTGNPLPW